MRTIKSRQDFEHVYLQGKRYNHPLVRMVVCPSQEDGVQGRVAFAASKRVGNAVTRNRSKRVLRETARACEMPVSGFDVILFATKRTKDASPDEMTSALSSLIRRAGMHG